MDKKIISILLIGTFCLSFLIQSPAFANTSEPWEVELETCLSQKKKASLLITNDISGSTSSTDPKGLRGSSTVAITRGLHEILDDINSSGENINFEIEIAFSTFNQYNKSISSWINLTNKPSESFLDNIKSQSNISTGGTAYSPALDHAITEFSQTLLVDSCKILVFMSDGSPQAYDPLANIDSRVKSLKQDGVFLIGVQLGQADYVLKNIFGEIDLGYPLELDYGGGVVNGPYSFSGIYTKAKVFDAKNATDLLNAFLNIGNKLRAIATNTSITESEEKSTSICTTNEECYYEQRIGVGTETIKVRMSVTDPGNENKDINIYIEPPPAMNINENLKTISPSGITKTQYGDAFITVTWLSDGEGEIKIDVDPNKTSWIGSWKFSLKSNSPNARTVTWKTYTFNKLVPKLPSGINLRSGQKTCIDIRYASETNPTNARVNILVLDPSDGSVLKTVPAKETPMGHEACITPDGSFPIKVKLQTDITYEPIIGESSKADVVESKVIEISDPIRFTEIGKPEFDKTTFKGEESGFFVFPVNAGNDPSVIEIKVTQLTSGDEIPGTTWYVSFKNQEYKIGEGDNKLTIPADSTGKLEIKGEPYKPGNISSIHYKVEFLTSIPSISGEQKSTEYEVVVDFLTVGNADLLFVRIALFVIFLLFGFLVSYIYNYMSSSLTYDRNLRMGSYKFKITNQKEITWDFKNLYESTFDETQIAKVSNKQVDLGSDLKISLKQGIFPAFSKTKAYVESVNKIVVNNKELENKTLTSVDVNKSWFFTLEKNLSGNGVVYVFVNNETSFEQIKNEFSTFLERLVLPPLNTGPADDGTTDEGQPPQPGSPPPVPGQGSPPPVPGQGSPPPVPGQGSPPPVPGQGSPPPVPGS
jgi:hypothetical protein